MPTSKTKSSSVKENTKSGQSPRQSKKADYRQFTEARYKKMSDKEFVKAFEEDNKNEDMSYTQAPPKLIPFFMANISRDDREDLQEQVDYEEVN